MPLMYSNELNQEQGLPFTRITLISCSCGHTDIAMHQLPTSHQPDLIKLVQVFKCDNCWWDTIC